MATFKNASATAKVYLTTSTYRLTDTGQLPPSDELDGRSHPFLSVLAPNQQVTEPATNGVHVSFFRDDAPAASTPRWPGAGRLIGKVCIRDNDDLIVDPDDSTISVHGQDQHMLDTFDHVVVLMLENRSFDNLLGYLYPDGVPASAPLGKTFDGLLGKDSRGNDKAFSNALPPGDDRPNRQRLMVTPVEEGNYFQPYPDPGEPYAHVMKQVYNGIPRADRPSGRVGTSTMPVPMEGFLEDYIENFKADLRRPPTAAEYLQFMQCYPTRAVPVLSTLAEQFGVFDRWFCAVPSQTWCNRAFWNAGTSWGWVVNPGGVLEMNRWFSNATGTTLFNQIEACGSDALTWKVYGDGDSPSLTHLIHFGALDPYYHYNPIGSTRRFFGLDQFYADCRNDTLPSYAFLEPRFFSPNNDMHPNSATESGFGKGRVGSVLLGEKLVFDVYEAIRNLPKATRDKTLLIITFDEHGGCYDHVAPPGFGYWNGDDGQTGFWLDPREVTAPDMTGYALQEGFDFRMLGVRVPTIMVSSHIARNTVVKTTMDHSSFARTVGKKWGALVPGKFPPLTARVRDAMEFTEVFTLDAPRDDWPALPEPTIPPAAATRDASGDPLGRLERSIVDGVSALPRVVEARKRGAGALLQDPATITTVGEAERYFSELKVALAAGT